MEEQKKKNDKLSQYLPVVVVGISVVLGIAFAGLFYYFIFQTAGIFRLAGVIILIITAGVMAAMIYVIYSRLVEIKRGEEDDLGKY